MTQRVLVFIVAYNAERTIAEVLQRIPAALSAYDTEVLVIDDGSGDATFEKAAAYERTNSSAFKVRVLSSPVNQGYGGNQKLGYQYAILHGFDAVALLHGDGQYAPEKLPDLIELLFRENADAVLGSRMMRGGNALAGGMPLYKWIGNRCLTALQNCILGLDLSEYHSGFRVYRVPALMRLPFERNDRGFPFDTEIIIQLWAAGMKMVEHPIPTHYGDEVCHVSGIPYALSVLKASWLARMQRFGIFYHKRFDVPRSIGTGEEAASAGGAARTGFPSTHALALQAVPSGSKVLLAGDEIEALSRMLQAKGCAVSQLPQHPAAVPPATLQGVTHILLLDIVEHAAEPDAVVRRWYAACHDNYECRLLVSTGNVAFLPVRLSLFAGSFRYGKRGILDLTHKRLFTFASFRDLWEESGFEVLRSAGVPAPYPLALGEGLLARCLLAVNRWLIRVGKGLFAYQIWMEVRPYPSVEFLLQQAINKANLLKQDRQGTQ